MPLEYKKYSEMMNWRNRTPNQAEHDTCVDLIIILETINRDANEFRYPDLIRNLDCTQLGVKTNLLKKPKDFKWDAKQLRARFLKLNERLTEDEDKPWALSISTEDKDIQFFFLNVKFDEEITTDAIAEVLSDAKNRGAIKDKIDQTLEILKEEVERLKIKIARENKRVNQNILWLNQHQQPEVKDCPPPNQKDSHMLNLLKTIQREEGTDRLALVFNKKSPWMIGVALAPLSTELKKVIKPEDIRKHLLSFAKTYNKRLQKNRTEQQEKWLLGVEKIQQGSHVLFFIDSKNREDEELFLQENRERIRDLIDNAIKYLENKLKPTNLTEIVPAEQTPTQGRTVSFAKSSIVSLPERRLKALIPAFFVPGTNDKNKKDLNPAIENQHSKK